MARPDRDSSRSLFAEKGFWLGLAAIGTGLVVFALLFNYSVMPIWTRHDAAVTVPDVRELTPGDAQGELLLAGLDWETQDQPFNPNIAPDVVVDQSPAAGTTVKPGRRVYLYVNASPTGLVTLPPDLVTMDTSNARARLEEIGLLVGEMTLDPRPGPTPGTIRSSRPAPGTQVPAGTRVALTWTDGPDRDREVAVPDVVALPASEARAQLEEAGFYVPDLLSPETIVGGQDPEAGTPLNPGEPVRLFAD